MLSRLVTFVELRRDLTIDDILKILEKCELFIKHHDKDHLDEWVKFCTRFVKFYRDGDNLIARLRDALLFQDTESVMWV